MNQNAYCGICKYIDLENEAIGGFRWYCTKHHTYKNLGSCCKRFSKKRWPTDYLE